MQTDRQKYRQTDEVSDLRQELANRQTDRQTDRQKGRTDRTVGWTVGRTDRDKHTNATAPLSQPICYNLLRSVRIDIDTALQLAHWPYREHNESNTT